jgi:hypothetical protein
MINMIIDRIIKVFQEPNNRERIQSQCIDPLIKYILNRMFPYIILICIIFCIILFLSFISVGLLILQLHPGSTGVATSAATGVATSAATSVATSVATLATSAATLAMPTPMPLTALADSLINTTSQ